MSVDPAFRMLYQREFPAVFRAAFLLSGDRHIAEEAAQEAFARALARWRRIGSQAWAGGWVTTTALNVVRRNLRRRPPPPAEATPSIDEADRLDVRAAVRKLPARQQEAVVLHYLLDMTVAETATSMGCDQGTVKTHLFRARIALERALAPGDEPAPQARSEDHG